jgi:hypothetical protein
MISAFFLGESPLSKTRQKPSCSDIARRNRLVEWLAPRPRTLDDLTRLACLRDEVIDAVEARLGISWRVTTPGPAHQRRAED